ncbi:MoaD/ThiS family protein [Pyrobaculum ferrireducens]|uniref:MoaD family protein n=1 Tax=Pyrobaculum ferrireducens TaxID=1104324 RepID=G7VCZ4_9CREN|nr:MoaD/ThiS family protein [Pyrobaculum ferrireducens]AET32683.1 MoaD family protein [Pyrobaculum ferrireducens]
MRIVVKIFGPAYFGLKSYDVITLKLELGEGATVGEALDELERRFPGLKGRLLRGEEVIPMHDIWINGRSIDFLNGLKTPLREGDVLQIIPPFGG